MSLSKRNFYYSILISLIFVALVAGYFAFMLPSLYADYVSRENLKSVVSMHKGFVETGSYENLEVVNPTGSFSIELPFEGSDITMTGKFYQMTVSVKDERLTAALDSLKGVLAAWEAGEETWGNDSFDEESKAEMEELADFVLQSLQTKDRSVDIKLKLSGGEEMVYDEAKSRVHTIDGILVLENAIEDGENQYISYIAAERAGDRYVFTLLPAMTPKMDEITPIVFGSLPMIGAVVLLLVLLFSQMYSKGIVNPIIRLADYALQVKNMQISEIWPIQMKRRDEIGQLAEELNEMQQKLRDSYLELEEKNRLLEDENKRQEVFLRASSHQLKTPVTAALLLVDGMLGKIGKYQDWEKHLPKVKAQLLSMRKIIEEILSLNHTFEQAPVQETDLRELCEEVLGQFEVQAAGKGLQIIRTGNGGCVKTKKEVLERIIDNLISNAVRYTPDGGKIEIRYESDRVFIENFGSRIPEEILPHIFEPFVSSERKEKGHGLGLYVVSYYAAAAGCQVEIRNGENSVVTEVIFKESLL